MTQPLCACGTAKLFTPQLIAQCPHCDTHCEDRAGCKLCATFTLETRKRTDAEYAREKTNG